MFLQISHLATLCRQAGAYPLHPWLMTAVLLNCSLSATAQNSAGVQYWMDVATLTVSGITNTVSAQDNISTDALGQLTGNASSQFGGTKGMQPGRWLDVALAVPAGAPVSVLQTIPKGQNMGDSLQLSRTKSANSTASPYSRQANFALRGPDDEDKSVEVIKFSSQTEAIEHNAQKKLLLYWGCGDRVRAGQPRQLDMTTASSDSPATGLKGRAIVEASPDPDSGVAIWPNSASRAMVPKEASLVGRHALSGDNIPANMQFDLKAKQDFMPALVINVNGIKGSATTLNWSRIATAQGYFLMATAKNNREIIIWTSSEQPEPGWGLMDYANNTNLAQWKRDKIVLAPNQTSCSIPAGIFSQTGGAMLNGIAYGEETHISSRSANWNARIRVKSATMQPFDESNSALLVASPNAPNTVIRTSTLDLPGTRTPGTEETLNILLTQVPPSKLPKCDPCKRPGEL